MLIYIEIFITYLWFNSWKRLCHFSASIHADSLSETQGRQSQGLPCRCGYPHRKTTQSTKSTHWILCTELLSSAGLPNNTAHPESKL